jgi:hypothetical protein
MNAKIFKEKFQEEAMLRKNSGKGDSQNLNRLISYLSLIVDNLEIREQPTCCQLTALEITTSIIFREVAYYIDDKVPISMRTYENILDLFGQVGSYVWDTKMGERLDSRADIIEGWYKACKRNQNRR